MVDLQKTVGTLIRCCFLQHLIRIRMFASYPFGGLQTKNKTNFYFHNFIF